MIDIGKMVSLCSLKNATAQRQLYNTYGPAMKALCRKHVKDRDDAQDIFQEGFIKVFERIGSLKDANALQGWLKQIFLNTAREYYRKKAVQLMIFEAMDPQREKPKNVSTEQITYLEYVMNNLDNDRLSYLIRSLEHPKNKIVPLYCYVQLSHAEISKILGITESNCKVHFHRAKIFLKKQILQELS